MLGATVGVRDARLRPSPVLGDSQLGMAKGHARWHSGLHKGNSKSPCALGALGAPGGGGGFSEEVTQPGAGSVLLVVKGSPGRESEWGKTCRPKAMTHVGNAWKSGGAGGGGEGLATKSSHAEELAHGQKDGETRGRMAGAGTRLVAEAPACRLLLRLRDQGGSRLDKAGGWRSCSGERVVGADEMASGKLPGGMARVDMVTAR